ncbi:MAG: restriction endonuclease subunit S [Christensenellales bacterium]|nr:MAG: restriction endonuclease subunit S [Clostridiales bacterium]
MEQKRLGDIATYINGYAFKPEDRRNEGLPIIRIQDLTGNVYNLGFYNGNYPEKIEINDGDVLISWSASLGVYIWNRGKALLNQHIFKVVFDKVEVNKDYFVFAVKYNLKKMESKAHGATMKHIVKKDFDDMLIPFPSIEKQAVIADILSKAANIIGTRQKELQKLDELIKARFVEMFGDPEINSMNLPVKPMTEVCEIIDGDRGKNYPTQEEFSDEGYCLFLNAKNVTSNGFSFENCMFVTKEKDELLRKGHLNRGDVVLTTRGTIGNLAFYDESVPYENVRINSGMVVLRMNHEIVSERFFIEQFKMQIGSIKEKIASGSAQPQLPISTMNKIVVLMPSVKQQQVFTDFVKQVDKSKLIIERGYNLLKI